MSALPAKHLFNSHEWQRFAETGFFAPGYRAELIEGEIIDMSPIGTNHGSCVDWLHNYLTRKLPETLWVRSQNPLSLGDLSAPEPDVAVVHYRDDYYRQAHPGAADVVLLIEVADTTLAYDRNTKAPLYARFAIQEYWIVNLPERCVEVYRQPQGGKYSEKTIMRGDELLQPLHLAGFELKVSQLFW